MIGLYLKSEDDPAKVTLLARLEAILGRSIEPREVVVFTPTATNMSLLMAVNGAQRSAFSWLCAWPAGTLEAVAFSSGLRAFRGGWWASLIDAANRSLGRKGRLLFPLLAGADAKGWWTTAWLNEAVGGQPVTVDQEYVVYAKGSGNTQPSILRWFLEDAARVVLDRLQSHALNNISMRELMIGGDAAPRLLETSWDSRGWGVGGDRGGAPTIAELISGFNYAIGGVVYKAAQLKHLIAKLLPNRNSLSLLDVGGGMGVIAAELLLTCDAVSYAACCEPSSTNLAMAQRIASRFPERMAGRFALAHATAESMRYDRRYHVISFLGSLLYVPRAHTASVLRTAWEQLEPDGLLVIHENIKHESYRADFDVMFTVEELDSYLAEFGSPSHWLSTATVSIDPTKVGERSVFRVLQKGKSNQVSTAARPERATNAAKQPAESTA